MQIFYPISSPLTIMNGRVIEHGFTFGQVQPTFHGLEPDGKDGQIEVFYYSFRLTKMNVSLKVKNTRMR